MKKSTLLMVLSLVLALALGVGGTMAYLQDTDEDVNVMTLGNVYIEQHEYERVPDEENGGYKTTTTASGTGYELREFTQEKPLYPSVGDYEKTDETFVYFDQLDENAGGEAGVAGALANVQDKFVVVENTGKSDAYVRTLFAFEGTDALTEYLGLGITEDWAWNDPKLEIVVDGATYVVMEAVYVGSKERHSDGILPAGEWTPSSLSQVFLRSDATNEVVEGLDTTKDGDYNILVLSQAVQTMGFENAKTALDTAFAPVDNEHGETVAEWFKGVWVRYEEEKAPDTWDGTADTAWYNDTDTEFMIMTAEQLAGFAELVDGGNTFEGKTVKVGKDLDLNNFNFKPVGDAKEGKAFKGTFDGRGHTIGNVFYEETEHSSGNLYNSLFSYTDGATIKNLKMDDILIARYGGELAAVAGLAKDTVFEDITLTNSRIAGYNNSIGGIVSETEGTCTFKNVKLDATNSVGTFWGSYDTACGGIVGYALDGSNIVMENCEVSCVIDSVNDACSNYMHFNYRRAGMLIGHVNGTENIDGVTYASTNGSLTCTDVKVVYDDWANYHYCEFEANGQGSYNAPDEFKFSRVEGTEYNGGHDVSKCEHSAVENNHNVLLVFDQLYGGGQGVKGQPTHDGVTVVYNNK